MIRNKIKLTLLFFVTSFSLQSTVPILASSAIASEGKDIAVVQPWEEALASGRRYGYHGQYLVDRVNRELGVLPAAYKSASLHSLKPTQVEFDRWKVSDSAVDAMRGIITAAYGEGGGTSKAVINWISNAMPTGGIEWGSSTVSGAMKHCVVELFDKIDKDHYFLFSAQLTGYQLELTDSSWLGMSYKKARIFDIQGNYGVLYFSKSKDISLSSR